MAENYLTQEKAAEYGRTLLEEERSEGTVEKYLRDIRAFSAWLDGRPVTREAVLKWRGHLLESGYAPVTVNSMLAALNGLFQALGWGECRVRFLKVQRKIFRETCRELTRQEYDRLLAAARGQGRERLALLMEAICATGIRVSEVRYLTVEAAQRGRAEIALKGKIRVILLTGKLRGKLLRYAKQQKPPPARFFAPEAEERSAGGRSGRS